MEKCPDIYRKKEIESKKHVCIGIDKDTCPPVPGKKEVDR